MLIAEEKESVGIYIVQLNEFGDRLYSPAFAVDISVECTIKDMLGHTTVPARLRVIPMIRTGHCECMVRYAITTAMQKSMVATKVMSSNIYLAFQCNYQNTSCTSGNIVSAIVICGIGIWVSKIGYRAFAEQKSCWENVKKAVGKFLHRNARDV